jgi:hypothetical protein
VFFRPEPIPTTGTLPPDPAPADGLPAVEDRAQMLTGLTQHLAWMREQHARLFDAADGLRADLLTRGWSPHASEGLAYTWAQRCLATLTPVAPVADGGQR